VIAYGLRAGHIAHNTNAMVHHGLLDHARDGARLTALLEKAISAPRPEPSPMIARQSAAAAVLELAARDAPAADRAVPSPGARTPALVAQG
jgi:hypothetical protein